jgi:hypothetical protein
MASSIVGMDKLTDTHDERATGDDRERVPALVEGLQAAAREPETALGRLVGIGGGADRDGFTSPGALREYRPEDLDDVRLHPDAPSVTIVRGPVCTPLERAHVAERAAVRAAHVRVQRPLERHPGDGIERGPAGLEAVIGGGHCPRLAPPLVLHKRAVRVAVERAPPPSRIISIM